MPGAPLRGKRKIFQDRGSGDRGENSAKSGLAFSWPILGALSIFLIGAVVWAFFMGFMVGQGHHPHAKIQEITGLSLPGESRDKTEAQAEEISEKAATDSALAQNDLPVEDEKPEAAFRKPKGEELDAWGEAPRSSPQAPAKKDKAPQAQKERLFDFSFQIAAFKTLAEAENLQKKLAAISVKTKIQKSGKVQLLIATIRGPAKTPENLQQKLLPLKLGKPLQLSKKELSTAVKRNK